MCERKVVWCECQTLQIDLAEVGSIWHFFYSYYPDSIPPILAPTNGLHSLDQAFELQQIPVPATSSRFHSQMARLDANNQPRAYAAILSLLLASHGVEYVQGSNDCRAASVCVCVCASSLF